MYRKIKTHLLVLWTCHDVSSYGTRVWRDLTTHWHRLFYISLQTCISEIFSQHRDSLAKLHTIRKQQAVNPV